MLTMKAALEDMEEVGILTFPSFCHRPPELYLHDAEDDARAHPELVW
jgi:hypothetical protein